MIAAFSLLLATKILKLPRVLKWLDPTNSTEIQKLIFPAAGPTINELHTRVKARLLKQ